MRLTKSRIHDVLLVILLCAFAAELEEKEQWYQEVLKNGRKTTYSTGIGEIFQEMTIYDNVQKYLYMGREILDYSGKNLGVMLIRLSETNIWGKLAASMVTEEGGAIYILDRNNNILMGYNEKYQKQLKELGEQESVKEISEKEIITGNLEDDFYYIAGELENAPYSASVMPDNRPPHLVWFR